MRHIPNIITSLNLASGFTAIIFILNGQPTTAAWIILAAMVFDFLDGFASRLLNAYSDLGKELDSLADAVSFGTAPGLLIYYLLSGSITSSDLPHRILIIATAAIFTVCACLRLAKFNIDTTQSTIFKGLPTPAAALAVVSVVLSAEYSISPVIIAFSGSHTAIMIFSLALSGLMVSPVPFLSLKFHDLKFRGNEGRFLLLATVVAVVAVFRFSGVPLIIPVYIVISLISLLF